jgi:hypothetical protein
MKARLLMILVTSPFLAAWGDRNLQWPHVGPMPDDPTRGGRSHYQSITAGTKSFRPVEPLPWGEINRRVAPPGALRPDDVTGPVPKNEKAPAEKRAPQHKH